MVAKQLLSAKFFGIVFDIEFSPWNCTPEFAALAMQRLDKPYGM